MKETATLTETAADAASSPITVRGVGGRAGGLHRHLAGQGRVARAEVGGGRVVFHAEGGVRDDLVAGVQACAVPPVHRDAVVARGVERDLDRRGRAVEADRAVGRSEERRVGKEGRSRWSPYH